MKLIHFLVDVSKIHENPQKNISILKVWNNKELFNFINDCRNRALADAGGSAESTSATKIES
jgi:hypothetical protein